jgi:5-methylcytosine-specific restriction endonuclease McrA
MPHKDPERARAWRAEYREQTRERSKAWGKAHRAKDPEREREKQRIWREANREHRKAWARAYRQRPAIRQKRRDGQLLRRAQLKEVERELVRRSVVWERDNGICGVCGQPADPNRWDLDHIIPLIRNGPHTYANVQVTHPICNQRKGSS